MGFIYWSVKRFWQCRHELINSVTSEEDRLIGHLLILSGAVMFSFFHSSVSFQALLVMLILVGIACSSWGLSFFRKFPLASALLLISVYPCLNFLANTVRRTLWPNSLESFMAWISGLALRAIGQSAVASGSLLSLSTQIQADKTVEVGSGCSGFDMAFTIAGVGLLMGLFLKQKWFKIGWIVVSGILLALMLNIPRIMLLAWAVVYWGKDSFEFWHGPIGGQIFAGILFTLYYYLVMWIVERQPKKARS
jgi:exosortase/archaeosortase family protein